MKPISDEADPIVAAFVNGLRKLVQDTVQDKPVGDLAQHGPLARSTLMHALSGRRMPTRQTLNAILLAIATYQDLPGPEMTELFSEWQTKLDAASRAERGESFFISTGSGKTMSAAYGIMGGDQRIPSLIDGVPGTLDVDTAYALADQAQAERSSQDERTDAPGVAAATAALDRALDRLEDASREVAQARLTLRQALARADEESPDTVFDGIARGHAPTIVAALAQHGLSDINTLASETGVAAAIVFRCLHSVLIPNGTVEQQDGSHRQEPQRYALTEVGRCVMAAQRALRERLDSRTGASNAQAESHQ